MFASLCFLCLSGEAVGQTLPEGKGKAEFVHNCTACHRADMTTRLRKTPDEWRKTVDNMAARGTDGSKEDLDNVVLYLVTNFAADEPGPAATTPSTTPPSISAGTAVLNSSEIERVKRIIAESDCFACRRIEKQGASTEPAWNGVGGWRMTDEIRTAMIRPHPTLAPSNKLVRSTDTR
ncbi:c-type cytochrome [Terriglobus saanensis]|nr:cytochrome c [Terriglobus saanensis]